MAQITQPPSLASMLLPALAPWLLRFFHHHWSNAARVVPEQCGLGIQGCERDALWQYVSLRSQFGRPSLHRHSACTHWQDLPKSEVRFRDQPFATEQT